MRYTKAIRFESRVCHRKKEHLQIWNPRDAMEKRFEHFIHNLLLLQKEHDMQMPLLSCVVLGTSF